MKKAFEFLKSKKYVIFWTIEYFAFVWLMLKFLFNFDITLIHHWHKFFHANFYGFKGFVFCTIVYSVLPIYIASTIVVNRKNVLLIKIPILDKIFDFLSKTFSKKAPENEPEQEPEPEIEKPIEPEYPSDLPAELRVPFIRAKHNLKLRETISVYNKTTTTETVVTQTATESFSEILPTDFDIDDSDDGLNSGNDFIQTFTDINFDEPKPEKKEKYTTKYFDEKHIEYEIYKDFIATEKYVIYEHNDGDFWIMDENDWFASGKQIDSPVPELINLAKQNGLIPVLYLQSQNIMDIENTITTFENMGVRVIKSLEELG